MKKKFQSMLMSFIILMILLVVYVSLSLIQNADQNEAVLNENENKVKFTEKIRSDINKMRIISEGNEFVLHSEKDNNEGWYMEEYQNLPLDNFNAGMIASAAVNLEGEKISGENLSLSDCGIDGSNQVTVYFSDESRLVFNIGDLTFDGKYYYMSTGEEEDIYLISSDYGNKFKYTVQDIIKKSVGYYEPSQITAIKAKIQGKDDINIAYGYPEGIEYVNQREKGLIHMDSGLRADKNSIYQLFENTKYIKLYTIASFNDTGAYGFQNPTLDMEITYQSESLHFLLGDEDENGRLYFKFYDLPFVYTVEKSSIMKFVEADWKNLTEKFISFVDIRHAQNIYIETESGNYILNTDKQETDNNGAKSMLYNPVVNGIEIKETDYKNFYERLKTITWDSIIFDDSLEREQKGSILYEAHISQEDINKDIEYGSNGLLENGDGTFKFKVHINLYAYDENFYIAQREGYSHNYLVSKRQVQSISEDLDKILNIN